MFLNPILPINPYIPNSATSVRSSSNDDPRTQTGWWSALTGGETEKAASVAQAEWASEFSAKEAEKARQFSAEQAEIQREYEKQLSNTAFKRAAEDMRNAGLNPALMYARGGMSASTPSGAAASAGGSAQGKMPNAVASSTGQLALVMASVVGAAVAAGGKVAAVNAAEKAKLAYNKAMMPSWW